jgi:hypothetical protein
VILGTKEKDLEGWASWKKNVFGGTKVGLGFSEHAKEVVRGLRGVGGQGGEGGGSN